MNKKGRGGIWYRYYILENVSNPAGYPTHAGFGKCLGTCLNIISSRRRSRSYIILNGLKSNIITVGSRWMVQHFFFSTTSLFKITGTCIRHPNNQTDMKLGEKQFMIFCDKVTYSVLNVNLVQSSRHTRRVH